MPADLENSAVPQDWKRPVFIPIPKKGNAKECTNYHTIALISHASKVMLKILQARLQQYVNWEIPNVQAGFRKGRGTRDQIASICWVIGKFRELKKKKTSSALFTVLKPLTRWITANWKIMKEVGIPDHLTQRTDNHIYRETCTQVWGERKLAKMACSGSPAPHFLNNDYVTAEIICSTVYVSWGTCLVVEYFVGYPCMSSTHKAAGIAPLSQLCL